MRATCPACGASFNGEIYCPSDGALLINASVKVATERAGHVIDGRYRIRRKVGEGATGVLFEAEHIDNKTTVALKIFDPELASDATKVEWMFREARTVSELAHPNIVGVDRCAQYEDAEETTTYIAMDWLEGEPLDALVEVGAMEPHVALDVTRQLCSALHAAHGCDILHGDLKPANVFVLETDDARHTATLVDFGVARLSRGRVSTVNYQAPELVRGEEIDGRADIYALGIMLYEMFAGSVPFASTAPEVVQQMHVYETPQPPSLRAPDRDIPAGLDDIVLRCLEKDPSDRFQNGQQMSQAIDQLIAAEFGRHQAAAGDDWAEESLPGIAERPTPAWQPVTPPADLGHHVAVQSDASAVPAPPSGVGSSPLPGVSVTPLPGVAVAPVPAVSPIRLPGVTPPPLPGVAPSAVSLPTEDSDTALDAVLPDLMTPPPPAAPAAASPVPVAPVAAESIGDVPAAPAPIPGVMEADPGAIHIPHKKSRITPILTVVFIGAAAGIGYSLFRTERERKLVTFEEDAAAPTAAAPTDAAPTPDAASAVAMLAQTPDRWTKTLESQGFTYAFALSAAPRSIRLKNPVDVDVAVAPPAGAPENLMHSLSARVVLSHIRSPAEAEPIAVVDVSSEGTFEFPVTFREVGTHRVTVILESAGKRLASASLELCIAAGKDAKSRRRACPPWPSE